MDKINFNDLPNDIKNLIFSKNRAWTKNEIYKYKRNYLEVLDHLVDIIETTDQIYYEANEEEEFTEEGYGFVYAMLECINEENLQNKYEVQEAIAFENYYGCE
tara:strand:+ start:198 stop:506 length:309 start_codon:yes stop_codon:yes gene_type:complete